MKITRVTRVSGKRRSSKQLPAAETLSGRRSAGRRTMTCLLNAFGMEKIPSGDDCKLLYEQAFACSGETNFAATYLVSEVFSKLVSDDPTSKATRQNNASLRFYEGEEQCAAANHRLTWDPYPTQQIERVLGIAQNLIRESLGEKFPWEEFILLCEHGTGATSCLPRRRASQQNKWVQETHVTATALPYAIAAAQYAAFKEHGVCFTWDKLTRFTVVPGDVLDSVNKNADTNRVIGKGPGWNVFLQKGVGRLHRRRLWKHGLLEKTAQRHHQTLAREGSRSGALATVDLKNASSTISHGLVELLYMKVPEWYKVMCDLRSENWEWGKEHPSCGPRKGTYEMFSAMGNGFTFEMETLMFWALTKACCLVLGLKTTIESCSVYGDDIICPTEAVPLIRDVFTHVGLTFNAKKSHWVGPFRESCGGHYYRGHEVTPFYVKRIPEYLPDLVNLHNRISLWLAVQGGDEPGLEKAMLSCRNSVPRKFWGPPSIEGVLWQPFHLTGAVWHRGHQAWSVETVSFASAKYYQPQQGAYYEWLWRTRTGPGRDVTDEIETSETLNVRRDYVTTSRIYFGNDAWSYGSLGVLAPLYWLRT